MGGSFVERKQRDLKRLEAESGSALDMITSTIDRLEDINSRIDVVMGEITEAQNQLETTKNDLNNQHQRNKIIAEKFKSLISAE